ncbi:hypothetical protein EJ05DRAFT_326009 [Pseudovirgaria hyperparasitica]|uniref:Glutamate--tRNA ligase, mitochondrial n=1 Tax=Pseudovirgaria hyperparasitica TaxID=470096 RepID=A0A6A6WA47_9PEZI|nr:uncharacterized protein EJ05DRAFT_326009 [Pseudovirgaria hyperparasitica]KAF2758904.1 hypothetical protein EJ05DRAFT_326009 [Pseudovirgaria hyperparasitica]
MELLGASPPARYVCHAKFDQITRPLPPIKRKRPTRTTRATLPSEGSKVRTRFAPSPTGSLHLGSARTALFNYLLAKRCGGQFILRIEDTDQRRSSEDFEKQIYKELAWLGLKWDEGPGPQGTLRNSTGPYKQSQRLHFYTEHVQRLLDIGKSYRCFCSPEALQAKAQLRDSAGLIGRYDRTCAHIQKDESSRRAAAGEPHTIRLLSAETAPLVKDLIFGDIKHQSSSSQQADGFDDPILMKRDGWPTYHLANVVDDHLMDVTHVIRGVEWIPSTPMHLELYDAFGWVPPKFAHVPLLTDADGAKLSKRDSAATLEQLRDLGIFPETVVNFAALLGWSHQERSDFMTLSDLERLFDLKLTKGNTVVSMGKMRFLQNAHAVQMTKGTDEAFRYLVDDVAKIVQARFGDVIDPILGSRPLKDYVSRLLKADVKNFTTSARFVEESRYLFIPIDKIIKRGFRATTISVDEIYPSLQDDEEYFKSAETTTLEPQVKETLERLKNRLDKLNLEDWSETPLKEVIDGLLTEMLDEWKGLNSADDRAAWKVRKELAAPFWHMLRDVISFGRPGVGLAVAMELLGRDECRKRFEVAMRGSFV